MRVFQPSAADTNSGAEEDEDAVVEASLSDRMRHMIQRRHEISTRNASMQTKKGQSCKKILTVCIYNKRKYKESILLHPLILLVDSIVAQQRERHRRHIRLELIRILCLVALTITHFSISDLGI